MRALPRSPARSPRASLSHRATVRRDRRVERAPTSFESHRRADAASSALPPPRANSVPTRHVPLPPAACPRKPPRSAAIRARVSKRAASTSRRERCEAHAARRPDRVSGFGRVAGATSRRPLSPRQPRAWRRERRARAAGGRRPDLGSLGAFEASRCSEPPRHAPGATLATVESSIGTRERVSASASRLGLPPGPLPPPSRGAAPAGPGHGLGDTDLGRPRGRGGRRRVGRRAGRGVAVLRCELDDALQLCELRTSRRAGGGGAGAGAAPRSSVPRGSRGDAPAEVLRAVRIAGRLGSLCLAWKRSDPSGQSHPPGDAPRATGRRAASRAWGTRGGGG